MGDRKGVLFYDGDNHAVPVWLERNEDAGINIFLNDSAAGAQGIGKLLITIAAFTKKHPESNSFMLTTPRQADEWNCTTLALRDLVHLSHSDSVTEDAIALNPEIMMKKGVVNYVSNLPEQMLMVAQRNADVSPELEDRMGRKYVTRNNS